jgi:Uma2 family endonuclease
MITETDLDELIRDRRIRLLVLSSGKRIWEASPSPLHQMIIDDIRATIRSDAPSQGTDGCGRHHLADVYIRLPDTSLVRPDIAIFCEPPPRQREALWLVPLVVIEIVSPGYESKDYEDLPPIYLANGVQDVVIVDVDIEKVTHMHGQATDTYPTPHTLDLSCGCRVRIAV